MTIKIVAMALALLIVGSASSTAHDTRMAERAMASAQADGITDGTRPMESAQRWEAAAMSNRALTQSRRYTDRWRADRDHEIEEGYQRVRYRSGQVRHRLTYATVPPPRPGAQDYQWLAWLAFHALLALMAGFLLFRIVDRFLEQPRRVEIRGTAVPIRMINTAPAACLKCGYRPCCCAALEAKRAEERAKAVPKPNQRKIVADHTDRIREIERNQGDLKQQVKVVTEVAATRATQDDHTTLKLRVDAVERRLGKPNESGSYEVFCEKVMVHLLQHDEQLTDLNEAFEEAAETLDPLVKKVQRLREEQQRRQQAATGTI